MNYILHCIFLLIWLIVWPFSAAIQAIWSYAKDRNREMNFFLFFVFCGLYGYVTNASYDSDLDLMRIYRGYDTLKDLNFIEALPYIFSVGDFSYGILWLLGKFNFPAQIVGFFSAAWFYSSWLLIIRVLYKELSDKRIYSILILSFLLFILNTYPLFFSGVRSSTGTMLVLLGVMFLFRNQRKKSLLWLCLATLFHFSFIVFLFLWVIYVWGNSKTYLIWIALFILLAGVYTYLMEGLCDIIGRFGVVGGVIAQKIQYYVFDYQDKGPYSFVIVYGSGWRFIANLTVIASALYIRILPDVNRWVRTNSFLYRLDWFTWIFVAFLIFISHNDIMLGRFFILYVYLNIIFLTSIYIFAEKQGVKNSIFLLKKCLYLLTFVCAGLSFFGLYREMILDYNVYLYTWKIFFQNIFSVFFTTINYK